MISVDIYKGNYMKLLLIPAVLFILFIYLSFVAPTPPKGIELKGGSLIILKLDKALDAKEVESYLLSLADIRELKVFSVSAPGSNGLTLEYAGVDFLDNAELSLETSKSLLETNPSESVKYMDETVSYLGSYFTQKTEYNAFIASKDYKKAYSLVDESYYKAQENFSNYLVSSIETQFSTKVTGFQKEEIAPTLGNSFWQTAINLSLVAVVLIIIVIFAFFRDIIPSIAILLAASFDILSALAFMSVFQISLSLSSIPALLMLIGYSVDTDIMLTSRLMNSKHSLKPELLRSMKTGLTMTLTTICALLTMTIVSYLMQITVIFNLAIVLLFGLFGDVLSTWLMNAPILLKYLESKGGKL